MDKFISTKSWGVMFAAFIFVADVAAQAPDTNWYASSPEADTFYISTADELAGLARIVSDGNDFRGKTVVLVDDIDLSEWGEWSIIGKTVYLYSEEDFPEVVDSIEYPFRGVFDGNGKTVDGVSITSNVKNGEDKGLFGLVDGGLVKNLGVVNVDIQKGRYAGAVVGKLTGGGVVTGCYSSGWIYGNAASAGGVVGLVDNGSSVTNSYSTIFIGAFSESGGVVGGLRNGSVANCYSTGSISAYHCGGGVVGAIYDDGIVSNCYSTGGVHGSRFNGYLIGGVAGVVYSGRVIDCAALNSHVNNVENCLNGCLSTGYVTGRIIGVTSSEDNVVLSGNIAFTGMGSNFADITGANSLNGADFTAEDFSILSKLFTPENGWTIESGKLPGLLGKAVDMPEHLIPVSIASADRVVPQPKPKEEATVIAPVVILPSKFTAGPNPVSRQSGEVKIFRQGKRVSNSELRIYDAAGNIVGKVKIIDNAFGSQARRQVGTWNLTDRKGRPVPEGTYLVRGVVKTSNGKGEKVSVILGVR